MKMVGKTKAAALAAGVVGLSLMAGGAAAITPGDIFAGHRASGVSARTSDDDVETVLAFNREEERVARDLYLLFAQTYDTGPFANIAASEQRHFDAVGRLLTAYDVADPAEDREPGDYADPRLQDLYDTWKAEGLTSLANAYQVGIALEEKDIADLEDAIASLTRADATNVLSRLLAASRMHLRAFTSAADGSSSEGTGPEMRWSGRDQGEGEHMDKGRRGRGGVGGPGSSNGNRSPRGDCSAR